MDHFHSLLYFAHRARELQNPSRLFAGCHCVEAFAIPLPRHSAFYMTFMWPGWEGLNKHCPLLDRAHPVLFCEMAFWAWPSSPHSPCRAVWTGGMCSRPLLRSASSRATKVVCIDELFLPRKQLLVALPPTLISFVYFMKILLMVYSSD